jgi:hypothetical protein
MQDETYSPLNDCEQIETDSRKYRSLNFWGESRDIRVECESLRMELEILKKRIDEIFKKI